MMIILSLIISIAHAGWQTGQLYVTDTNSNGKQIVYFNTQDGVTDKLLPPGVWNTISVTDIDSGIPSDAKSLFIHGVKIITHGNAKEQCSLTYKFRAIASEPNDAANYSGVSSCPPGCGGIRANDSFWAPVKDGKVQFYWSRTTDGLWPDKCSYGLNLNVQGYIK